MAFLAKVSCPRLYSSVWRGVNADNHALPVNIKSESTEISEITFSC